MNMGKLPLRILVSTLLLICSTGPIYGQDLVETKSEGDLNLYVDCNFCDRSFIRESVTFVNHVRDLEESDVQVLVLNTRTGSGGNQFEFDFMGRGKFEGEKFKLKFFTSSDASWDEIRKAWVQKLMTGLVYFAAKNPDSEGFTITSTKTTHEKNEANKTKVHDPWNYWVFDVDFDGSFQTESSQSRNRIGANIESDRVTEDWKFDSNIYFNRNIQSFDTDEEEITSTSEWKGTWGRLVKSMGPHFSSGLSASVDASTFRNNDGTISVGPAFEYSFFPYSEFTRRILTIEYSLRAQSTKYIEPTIFDKTSEALIRHDIEAQLQFITPTGYAFIGAEFSQYLHDFGKNSIELDGTISQRIFKGFSIDLNLGMEIIHDQLYLPKGDASLEEVLLRRRQLATTFEYNGSIGLSYTFGSIYNNVVNSRL